MFEELAWFGETFALEGEGGLVFFKGAGDSGGVDGQEFFPDGRGDAEGGLKVSRTCTRRRPG